MDTPPFDIARPLESCRDRFRLLLVCAPSERDPAWEEQRRLLDEEGAAFEERDLLLGLLLEEGTSLLDGHQLPEEAVAEIRSRFDLPPKRFCLLLIGKDGTEKLREDTPIKPDYLYEVIDAMPMRRREMNS